MFSRRKHPRRKHPRRKCTQELLDLLTLWNLADQAEKLNDNEVFSVQDLECMTPEDVRDWDLPAAFNALILHLSQYTQHVATHDTLHTLLGRLRLGVPAVEEDGASVGGVDGKIAFEWVRVSDAYDLSVSGSTEPASSTIRSWIDYIIKHTRAVVAADVRIGCGVMSADGTPEHMKWSTYSEMGGKTFRRAFGSIRLEPGEKYLVVYNLFVPRKYIHDLNSLGDRVDEMRRQNYEFGDRKQVAEFNRGVDDHDRMETRRPWIAPY